MSFFPKGPHSLHLLPQAERLFVSIEPGLLHKGQLIIPDGTDEFTLVQQNTPSPYGLITTKQY